MTTASSPAAPPAASKDAAGVHGLSKTARGLTIACTVGALLVYLLPFSIPGERLILLLCLAGFWIGLIATVWKRPPLRLFAFVAAAIQFFPVRTGTTRLLLLLGLASLWLCAVVTYRTSRSALIALLGSPLLVGAFLLLPGRPIDRTALRAETLRSLTPYRDTPYVWGGENRVGIDCSGLIRCGWIDANLRCGIRTANPALLRTALQTWQQDCSAKELGDGYRGRTTVVLLTPALNSVDYTRILPGDVGVTESGVHTLAYISDKTWIEADPLLSRVDTLQANVSRSAWLNMPMKIVRWRALDFKRGEPDNVVY